MNERAEIDQPNETLFAGEEMGYSDVAVVELDKVN